MLVCLSDTDRKEKGNLEKIPEGSAESRALGQLALQDEEHYRQPFPDIAKELGISVTRSTIENVMHNHHSIFRYKGRRKPALDNNHKHARFIFADMAIHITTKAMVFSNEMCVEFNSTHRKGNVPRQKGANAYDFVIHYEFNPNRRRSPPWPLSALTSWKHELHAPPGGNSISRE